MTQHLHKVKDLIPAPKDGKGVSSTNIYYKADSSTPSTPSGAPASNPSWADNGNSLITNSNATKHLYESTCTTYTDGTYSWSTPIDDGLIQDMASTAEQFALADSGTTAPSSGWSSSVTPTAGKWVWSRTVLTFKDNSTKVVNTQCVGYYGTNGTGKDAPVLTLEPSVILYDADSDGKAIGQNLEYTFSPSMTVGDETIVFPSLICDVTSITNVTYTPPSSRPRQAAKLTITQGAVAEGDVKIEALGEASDGQIYIATGFVHVAPNKKGQKGDNAFSVSLDKTSYACETLDGDLTRDYDFYITIYAYYGNTNVLSACTVNGSCTDGDIDVNVTNDKLVRVRLYADNGLAAVTPVSITVTHPTYGSRTLVCNLTRVERGSRGNRGPALRGPQLYADCASDFQFMQGADGEEFLDVVIDSNDNFYKCKKSHVKSSGVAPGATGWETYWSLGTKYDLVATQILLATYALIKNLGVENVEAKDANNNTIFSIRNGILVCNGGTIGGFKISSSKIGAEDVDPNNFLWIDSTGKIRIVRTGTGNALDILGNILLNGNGGTFTLNNAANNGTIKFLGRLNVDTGYLKTSSDSKSVGDIYRDANGFLKIQT